jgi:hypothetical protein
MNNTKLVSYFVDGSPVDFNSMLSIGLIKAEHGGYVLTDFGKSFLQRTSPRISPSRN